MMRRQILFQVGLVLCLALTVTAADKKKAPINPMFEKSNKMWMQVMEKAPSITVDQLKKAKASGDAQFVILDIRTGDEFKAGYIDGAIHADRNAVEFYAAKAVPEPDTTIYVYCMIGARAASATLALLDLGYQKVFNISGGIHAWANAGYPVHNELGEFTFTKTAEVNWQ